MQFTPTQKHVAAWLLIAFLAVLALWLLGRVLTPFVVAAVLAYALTPLVDRLDELGRAGCRAVISVAIVELLLILVLVLLVLIVVPVLAKEVPLIREQLPFLFDRLNATITPWLEQLGISLPLDLASIKAQLVKYLSANFEDAVSSIFSSLRVGGGVALIVVGYALLVPVALFYLLLDWKQVVARVLELVPRARGPAWTRSRRKPTRCWGNTCAGKLLVMVTMAAFYSIGLALFGLDLAVPIGCLYRPGHVRALRGFRHRPGARRRGRHTAIRLHQSPRHGSHGVWVRPDDRRLLPDAASGGPAHRLASPRRDLRSAGIRPAVRIPGVLVALPASAVLFVAIRRCATATWGSKLYQN
jgi:hypothetical protein